MSSHDDGRKGIGGFAPIGAAVLGGAAFVVLFIIFDVSIVISLVGAAGGFIAGLVMFGGRGGSSEKRLSGKGIDKALRVQLPAGITREVLDQALAEGRYKLNLLKGYAAKIRDLSVRKEADAICDITERILKNIEQDPKDLRPARQFLNYYLDATVKILRRYVDISSRGLSGGEIASTLKKVEDSLSTIHRAFEKQLAKLLEDDVMDLDTELEVLDRTIRMEGLGDDETR